MNYKCVVQLAGLSFLFSILTAVKAPAQFVAFNDHAPGAGTAPNTTTWNVFGAAPGASGPLKDITTGANLPVTLTITISGTGGNSVTAAATQGNPAPGTPLYNTFNRFVDFQGAPNPSVQLGGNGAVTYTFTGLNPGKLYSFKGSAVRGNPLYTNRWALFEIVGADLFTSAHTARTLTSAQVPAITASQVAINTGVNNTAASGDMAVWEGIDPGADGSFAVTCRRYAGTVPGGSSAGTTAYAITGLRLEEINVTPAPVAITSQPQDQTVGERQPVAFVVVASGNPAPAYQWHRNDVPINGATNASYTISEAPVSDDNARFSVAVANTLNSLTSSSALLRVLPDITPPRLLEAQTLGLAQVKAIFSERVTAASAANIANYLISGATGGSPVLSATPDASQTNVILNVNPLTEGASYTLTVNGISDLAATANGIAANSQAMFVAVSYKPQDVGSPAVTGSTTPVTRGYDLTGSGADIGGTGDQFHFGHQQQTGNFDIRVRVESLDLSDVWAKAGLMARETLDANSPFAAALATPTLSGSFFESRATRAGNAAMSGSFPVNYPNTWLRLQRAGNVFTGYAGADGQNWVQLGSVTVPMATTIYLGMAVTSHNPSQSTSARLRDLSTVAGGAIGNVTPNREPPGPSSRKTGLAITEIMYKPAPRADGRVLDFIELFNANPFYEDISGYRIAGDIDFTFPPNTIIRGGAFIVLAKVPDDVKSVYGLANVMGPYGGSLKTSGTVLLRNQIGAIYLEIPYVNQSPWPVAADGTGHSLVLARPSYGEGYPQAWDISDIVGGSPGAVDGYRPSPLRDVVINEFLAHTDPPLVDFIELYNHSNQAVDISGCVLTDDPNTNKFVIPPNTAIPARGFASFAEAALKFALSAAGETIYLKSADGTRVLDAIQFEGQENGVSSGRFPDGAPDIYPLAERTPEASNSRILVNDIVINEIMYEPISEDEKDQYVELYNKGTTAINLGGWRFTEGINFTFPGNTVIPPDGYLVVAKSVTHLLAKYAGLTTANTVGNFSGRLAGKGERLVLAMPDVIINTNTPGIVTTNLGYVVVDEVAYASGGRWGNWANGGGSSLELIDPRANHRLPSNWADSDETAKAPWTAIQATGTLSLGSSRANSPIDRLEVQLLGEGECLLDNIEVIGPSGVNLVANPAFETGLTGWTPQGNHARSTLENTEGFNSSQSLHIRASSRGDPGPNRVRTPLTSALANGQTVTIRAQARWLRGWPEPLLRIDGNYFEATGKMTLPANLGTPGARNSRAVANAGPAIYAVAHNPVVPAANEPVVVTARIHDPDGFSAPRLAYRLDPSPSATTVDMTDGGTDGDAVAGDGIYSATIPGQSAGTLAAFYLSATDAATPTATALFPNDAPARECLVRFGDPAPASSFGTYRQWFTQSAVNSWINRPVLSNERVTGTFVYGNFRAIYNFSSRYAGSPYHQGFSTPLGNCHYSIEMPLDDLVLGTENFNKVHAPGNGPFDDNTSQREQTAYWLARKLDLPWNYRRYVVMYVNGNRRGQVMEDSQTPGSDVVEQYFPDDADGDLYKLQPWFEFDDGNTGNTGFDNKSWITMNNYVSDGVKKLARYRWNYLKRAAQQTANDYSNVFQLVDTANLLVPGDYTDNMDALVDTDEWMGIFAVEHACGNWDSFGYRNSQNMYGYKPQRGKWTLMIWDYNIVLGNSGSDGPNGNNLFNNTLNNQDQGAMARFYNNPKFRRAYLRAFKELADGPMQSFNVDPVMDAKYDAFVADGLTITSPAAVKTWIGTMRQSLLSAVATQGGNSSFAITSNGGGAFSTDQNLVTLAGTAPVDVKAIEVNGVAYALRWTAVTAWALQVPIQPGANVLTVEGFDRNGNTVTGAQTSITVTHTGAGAAPEQSLVINEIMYNPATANASFVEIHNTSSIFTFDLSRYRLDGVDFTFPDGTLILPGAFLVVANDRIAFANAYGGSIPVAGEFGGRLQNNGEILKLVKPGATPAEDLIVNRMRYETPCLGRLPPTDSARRCNCAIHSRTRRAWPIGPPAAPTPVRSCPRPARPTPCAPLCLRCRLCGSTKFFPTTSADSPTASAIPNRGLRFTTRARIPSASMAFT
jgi:regulation of enolase protein 1 (concanavalin A-like superfamily)